MRLHPGLSALLETGVMFLPAIPAYLWIWPAISGASEEAFQVIVYLYCLVGAQWIARRRWSLDELGFNRRGLQLTLGCGLALLLARLMLIYAVDFGLPAPRITPLELAWDIFYFIALVGLVEELVFRGLIYRALADWLGAGWAIWGSAIGFILWHIFGQGPLVGLAGLIVGLIFALIRWRTGSLLWLIFLHGLWDLQTILLLGDANSQLAGRGITIPPPVTSPVLLYLGTALFFGVPLYLWLGYPRVTKINSY